MLGCDARMYHRHVRVKANPRLPALGGGPQVVASGGLGPRFGYAVRVVGLTSSALDQAVQILFDRLCRPLPGLARVRRSAQPTNPLVLSRCVTASHATHHPQAHSWPCM